MDEVMREAEAAVEAYTEQELEELAGKLRAQGFASSAAIIELAGKNKLQAERIEVLEKDLRKKLGNQIGPTIFKSRALLCSSCSGKGTGLVCSECCTDVAEERDELLRQRGVLRTDYDELLETVDSLNEEGIRRARAHVELKAAYDRLSASHNPEVCVDVQEYADKLKQENYILCEALKP